MAEMIQARIRLENKDEQDAIDHYQQAQAILERLVDLHHRNGNNDKEEQYHKLDPRSRRANQPHCLRTNEPPCTLISSGRC